MGSLTHAPSPVSVTGGSASMATDPAELVVLAGRFGATATDTLGAAAALHGYLAEPAVVLSSVVDPVGFASFETELLMALDGWHGLGWAAAACAGLDAQLRLAAASYRAVDQLSGALRETVHSALHAGPALAGAFAVLAHTGNPIAAAEAALTADPQLADLLIDMLGVPDLLRAAAGALPDGHGVVRATAPDRSAVARRPPRGLPDVLTDLARRNGDERHGEIDVRILTMPDGSRRAIVDITGTKSWDPLPTRDVTSLTTNGRALVGEHTAYEDGVLAAMRRAGVRAADDVMLVGHSQGGLIAVTTARDALASGAFNVTHVVTAGAPIGRTVGMLPRTVQVLALENTRDVVPHLDGLGNPDRRNVTTVSSAHGDGTVLGDHDIDAAYVPIAADAQASDNRSIQDFLSGAAGYFQAREVVTHTFQIQRGY
jgi:hypothetical protein